MAGIRISCNRSADNYFNNGKLSGNKSSDCKSCEEFENGIKNKNKYDDVALNFSLLNYQLNLYA